MRQLTASQKIAILETRVAQLEKQAFIDSFKQQASENLTALSQVKNKVGRVFKEAGGTKAIAREYVQVYKQPEFRKSLKDLKKQAGNNPIKQINYLIDLRNNPQTKQASIHKMSFNLMEIVYNPEIVVFACLLVATVLFWLKGLITGKKASLQKESFFNINISTAMWISVVTFIVGWFMGRTARD